MTAPDRRGRSGRSGAARPVALLATLLVAAALFTGSAAAPAEAAGPPAHYTAQSSDEWGYEVRDRFGISIADYTIEAPEDSSVLTRLVGWVADFQLSWAKILVTVAVAMLRFALDFTLADLLLEPIQQLVDVYQTSFVGTVAGGGWGLIPLALMICVFWFGLAALRGRVGRGVGEITLSFVLAIVLGAVLVRPEILLGDEGLYGRAKDIGIDVAVTAVRPPQGHDPPPCPLLAGEHGDHYVDGCWHPDDGPDDQAPVRSDPQYLRWVMQKWLVDLYIRQAHQRMAYGQRIDCPLTLAVRGGGTGSGGTPGGDPCEVPYEQGGRHACVNTYNEILRADPSTAPVAETGWQLGPTQRSLIDPRMGRTNPENYMYDMMRPGGIDGESGCDSGEELAAYLQRPHTDRLAVGGVLLVAVLMLVLFVLLGVVIPIMVGQLLLAVLVVALVFILPVALLGGASRQVLWRWFGLLLAAIFMIVSALVGLALMLITTELLLRGNQQFFVMSLLLASVSSLLFLVMQRRLLRGAMAGGSALGSAAGRVKLGGRAGGAGAAGPGAVAAGAPGGGWSRAATSGPDAVTGIGRAAAARSRQRRQAVRHYDHHKRAERTWEERNWGHVLVRDLSQERRWRWARDHWQRRGY